VFWVIISRKENRFKPYYIESGSPCNKGEIGIHLLGVNIIMGWKRRTR